MRSSRKKNTPFAPGVPKADFLPDSLRNKRAIAKSLRRLREVVIASALVCVTVYIFATVISLGSAGLITLEQDRVQRLVADQGKYKDIRTMLSKISQIEAVRIVALAPEVMWADFFASLQATLPAGSSTQSITIVARSTMENSSTPKVALKGESVATVTLVVLLPSLSSIEQWVKSLESISGVADVTLNSASSTPQGYQANVSLSLTSKALANRYLIAASASATATPSPTPTPSSSIVTPTPTPSSSIVTPTPTASSLSPSSTAKPVAP